MSLISKAKKARSLPPTFVAQELARRAKKHVIHKARKIRYSFSLPKMSDSELLKKTGEPSLEEVITKIESCNWFFFSENDKKDILKALKRSNEKNKTLKKAENVLRYDFDILGSKKTNLGKEILWNKDFVSGKSWDNKYYKDIKTVRFDGSDVKIPWELSRCQHFITLGKAYWHTNDEKYAKEFADELDDWIEKNPASFSVNWTTSMEIAIRAVSWIWGYHFFRNSKAFSDELKIKMFKSLYFHAKHIQDNLEYNSTYSGNHYFSNGIGLLYIGLFMKPFKESKQWKDTGVEIVLDSMKNQILADGVDFEKSAAYHRLVSDFSIHAHILCKKNKIPLPKWFDKKLIKMLEFIAHYTKPDGTAPLVGDADDGRLVILEENKDLNDHRHHLSTGAVLFKNSLFKKQAGKFHEESLWLLGTDGKKQFQKQKSEELKSMGFHDGGFFISRNKNNYLFADCGGLGLRGLGGHGHNDTLSFELFAGDKTFITDSGTYTYSRDCVQRAKFRKTASHNTIEIDGKEMAPFSANDLWHIKDITNAKLTCWSPKKDSDVFAGQHEGYKRLGNLLVKRKITAEKKKGVWHIEDEITGNGTHDIALYFHFAPTRLTLKENMLRTKTKGTNISLEIESPKEAKLELIKDFISYSYGRKTESKTLKVTKKCVLPAKFKTTIKVCV